MQALAQNDAASILNEKMCGIVPHCGEPRLALVSNPRDFPKQLPATLYQNWETILSLPVCLGWAQTVSQGCTDSLLHPSLRHPHLEAWNLAGKLSHAESEVQLVLIPRILVF